MTKLLLLFMVASSSFAFASESSDLTISITGIKPAKGKVIITIYRDSDSWLKPKLAVASRSISSSGVEAATHFSLSPGSYAIQAFQDENDNGKLDMRWLPPGPAEPWVVSNNAQGTMGPPAFNDAKFDFPAQQSLSLSLQ